MPPEFCLTRLPVPIEPAEGQASGGAQHATLSAFLCRRPRPGWSPPGRSDAFGCCTTGLLNTHKLGKYEIFYENQPWFGREVSVQGVVESCPTNQDHLMVALGCRYWPSSRWNSFAIDKGDVPGLGTDGEGRLEGGRLRKSDECALGDPLVVFNPLPTCLRWWQSLKEPQRKWRKLNRLSVPWETSSHLWTIQSCLYYRALRQGRITYRNMDPGSFPQRRGGGNVGFLAICNARVLWRRPLTGSVRWGNLQFFSGIAFRPRLAEPGNTMPVAPLTQKLGKYPPQAFPGEVVDDKEHPETPAGHWAEKTTLRP